MIGASYIYPTDPDKKAYKLKSTNGFIFHFECGHWCTDNVFIDLFQITLF